MTQNGEKKKKADNGNLNHMIFDLVSFLEAVKAKPSICWMDEPLKRLSDCHGYVSSHLDLFFSSGSMGLCTSCT
jgi:hypothetical protein